MELNWKKTILIKAKTKTAIMMRAKLKPELQIS